MTTQKIIYGFDNDFDWRTGLYGIAVKPEKPPDYTGIKNKSGFCRICEYKFTSPDRSPCCVCNEIKKTMPCSYYKEVVLKG